MIKMKEDPRFVRTRRLIKDAFINLSMKKDFKAITITDITTEATVNRATFYYHFIDKYDLLEQVLKEDLMENVLHQIMEHSKLTEESITSVFLSVSQFQKSLSHQYQRSIVAFSKVIEDTIKKELEQTFYNVLVQQYSDTQAEWLRILAVMLSWDIYAVSIDWQENSKLTEEEYIKMALPLLTQRIDLLSTHVN